MFLRFSNSCPDFFGHEGKALDKNLKFLNLKS